MVSQKHNSKDIDRQWLRVDQESARGFNAFFKIFIAEVE